MKADNKMLSHQIHRCGHVIGHYHGTNMSQIRVLRILYDNGEMSQKDLTEMMMIRPASISELLSKLEGYGYVVKRRDDKDKRNILLSLTEKGKENYLCESKKHEMFLDYVFDEFTENEKEQLAKYLEILLERSEEYFAREDNNGKL